MATKTAATNATDFSPLKRVGRATISVYINGLVRQAAWATNMMPLVLTVPPDWTSEEGEFLMAQVHEAFERVRLRKAAEHGEMPEAQP